MFDRPHSTSTTLTWRPGPDQFPVLFERYQLLGTIGQGGMGTVFKGHHLNLKRFVAIKALRVDQGRSTDLTHRFLREMEAIGRMDHPNVVRAMDAGERNGVFYLVMEYLTGSDLSRLLAERDRLDVADACELARQAALGLDYIHQTVVHRDVKPSNLMLTTEGLVKVLDLGLARLSEPDGNDLERTPDGCAMGTYDYMAPEQAGAGAPLDGRADVYALGCTLFKLLTGRAPFSGPRYDSAAKKLFAHCHVPLTAVEGLSSIPAGLGAVLLRMTAKAPDERYQSAREVAQALTPFAAGCQLLRLLDRREQDAETPIRALDGPWPEELSRLTQPPHETPRSSRTDPATEPPAKRRGWRIPIGLGLLACVLAALAAFAPGFLTRPGPGKTDVPGPETAPRALAPGPVALDDLKPRTHHRLLDRQPIPIGCDPDDQRRWRWDQGQHLLDVKGPGTLLFPAGTTSRSRYDFEAGIAQAPWMGQVGLFWGYREDAALRGAKAPDKVFARFQMLVIWHRTGPQGEDLLSVRRGKAALHYDALGEMQTSAHYSCKHDVPLHQGEKILAISVQGGRLSRAVLGQVELTKLYSDAANKTYAALPYQGALGAISLSHHATFSNLRFLAHSAK